jgi:hypothetical protein
MEKIGVLEKQWHKGCFKCSDDECTLTLNLKTVRTKFDRIWCAQHEPRDVPNVTNDSMQMTNARDAPKVANVSSEQRVMEGVDRKGSQQLSFSQTAQQNAPKVETVSNEQRVMEGADRKGTQAASMTTTNAMSASFSLSLSLSLSDTDPPFFVFCFPPPPLLPLWDEVLTLSNFFLLPLFPPLFLPF